jgi:Kef-type K+ transport system membrane component KefB
MSFDTLALISAIGLLGPVLAMRESWRLPVILGELFAGIIFGASCFHVLNAEDPTFSFLADVGFAVVMFVAGTHVPVRDPDVRPALGIGAVRAAVVGLLAAAGGFAVAHLFHTGHAWLYTVLMASSSAAVVLPIIDSLQLRGTPVLQMTAQVAIADTAASLALPLVVDPRHAGKAALGAAEVALAAVLVYFVLRYLGVSGMRRKAHQLSERRKFALELRISLVVLFALAALAAQAGVSVMLAGFTAGLAVAAVGEPRRVAKQLFALNDGFLGPLYFIWLGARINLRDFGSHPKLILLGVALGLGAVVAHALMRAAGQPVALGTLAAAQIGVPAAAVTVGTRLHVLAPGEPAALILGALITIAAGTAAAGRFTGSQAPQPPSSTNSPGNSRA